MVHTKNNNPIYIKIILIIKAIEDEIAVIYCIVAKTCLVILYGIMLFDEVLSK